MHGFAAEVEPVPGSILMLALPVSRLCSVVCSPIGAAGIAEMASPIRRIAHLVSISNVTGVVVVATKGCDRE